LFEPEILMPGKNSTVSLTDNQLTRLVRESAHQVWLAGLGAYARAEAEGSRFFEGLVGVGERIEQGARHRVLRQVQAAEQRVTDVRQTALLTWDRIETLVEHRIAAALNRLQIPTARDVRELSRRVEALQSAVEKLESRPAKTASVASVRSPRAKTAKKTVARKKSPGRKRTAPKTTTRRRAAGG
jgi:poly(hydroxyalkanoate) granule-associated protein